MQLRRLTFLPLFTLSFIFLSLDTAAQEGAIIRKLVTEVVERVAKKGAKESAEELARIGGEKAVKEVLEKAAKEGGEELAQKVAKYAGKYGVAVLSGAERSPQKFILAFEKLPTAMRTTAIQAVRREPQLMAELVEKFGVDALSIAAKHPGIGGKLLRELGEEGAVIVKKLSTDQAIQLSKVSHNIALLTKSQRKELLDLIKRFPEKVIVLLEKNPTVLKTGAFLTAFLASKDQLLGDNEVMLNEDGEIVAVPEAGLLERLLRPHMGWLLGIVGFVFICWAVIKLWASYHISQAKVASASASAKNGFQKAQQDRNR